MNMIRYNPFQDAGANVADRTTSFLRLSPLGNLFDRIFESTWDTQEFSGDFLENDESYELRFDLPGFPKASIQLALDNGRLRIEASVNLEGGVQRSFRQAVTLPDRIDPDGIRAEARNGVLTIRLPKAAEHRPRSIEVE